MPRGRKPAPKNLEEQIALLEAQITDHKEAIEELKAKLKVARAAKKKEDTETLLAAIEASGKTVEDVLATLQGEEPEDEE